MLEKSKYLSRKVLDHVLGTASLAAPSAVFLALFSSLDGLDDGTLTHEVSGGGYARQAMTFSPATDADGAVLAAAVSFPVATSDWGDMVGWAIMDAATAGHVLYWGEFPQYGDPAEYKVVYVGDSYMVRSGDMSITEA